MSDLLKEFIQLAMQERIRSKMFNIMQFKQIDDPAEAYVYVREAGLKPLGEGSSRWVFLLSSGKVLKLANPQAVDKGRAQNEAEVELFTNPRTKPIIAKIFDYDPSYNWLISETVRPHGSNDTMFHKKYGIPFSTMVDFMFTASQGTDFELSVKFALMRMPKAKAGLSNPATIEFLKGVMGLVTDSKMAIGDLQSIKHWGVTGDGRIVLLDYGATDAIMKQHYKTGERPEGNPEDATVKPGQTKG